MREGLDFAWEGKWENALAAFEQALAEEPDDPVVHSHMGMAYHRLERFESALVAYTKASQLAPEDPIPLARIAEVQEQSGQSDAAANTLFSIAEIYQRQRDWTQAIQAFQRAILLRPDHLPARIALAEIYSQLDQPLRAITEYLNLARVLQQQGQVEKALEQCRKALELDPRNPEARALTRAFQRGELGEEIVVPRSLAEEGASPADIARDKALEELANIPFEDRLVEPAVEPPPAQAEVALVEGPLRPELTGLQIDALVAKAIDFQTRGLTDEAIACYTKVIAAGVDRPAAHFNLGLLYQQRLRFEPAIAELKKAAQDPEYVLGSHFALGECYKASGRIDDALQQFVQVLKIVDLDTAQREQADELVHLYDALADSYIAKGDSEKALAFVNSLIEFLTSKGWQDKARQARERLDGMSEEGDTVSLAELVAAPNADTILAAMSLSQEYVKRGAFTAATELCYEALEVAPGYLPLHLRLAEIFSQEGRLEDAIAKYEAVADLCLVREEPRQTIGVYRRILRLKPMDVVIRSRLIDLLISSGEIDEALEQYAALADAYFDLAQPDKALEKCTEALRLVPRSSNEGEWKVHLLRNIAENHMRRAHWREAVAVFHQILTVAPEDERAHLNLIDLYFRLGRADDADRETVAMLEYYHSQGEDARALALLEEAVRLEPQQMPLRARLARAYVDAGKSEEAIRELDALGELQLDAGLRKQAAATVRLIISLHPENIDAYRRLLAQL
jgi:tetratricopeptide (TPR) repeat protein